MLTVHTLSPKGMSTSKEAQGYQSLRTGSLKLTQILYQASIPSDPLHRYTNHKMNYAYTQIGKGNRKANYLYPHHK